MPRPITISINLSKIDKQYLHTGKTGDKYLNIALFENRNGVGQYGDTHFATQDIPKEARDRGYKGAIIGNAKFPQDDDRPRREPERQTRQAERPARDYPLRGDREQKAPRRDDPDDPPFDF